MGMIWNAIKALLEIVVTGFLYVFFSGLLLVGEMAGWRGIKGIIGGQMDSTALLFVGVVMVAVAWFGGRRVISYVSLKLTGVDDMKEGL